MTLAKSIKIEELTQQSHEKPWGGGGIIIEVKLNTNCSLIAFQILEDPTRSGILITYISQIQY